LFLVNPAWPQFSQNATIIACHTAPMGEVPWWALQYKAVQLVLLYIRALFYIIMKSNLLLD
jgi:hypothetical protein